MISVSVLDKEYGGFAAYFSTRMLTRMATENNDSNNTTATMPENSRNPSNIDLPN